MENKQIIMDITQCNEAEIINLIAGKNPEEAAKIIAKSVEYTLKTQQDQKLSDHALKLYKRISKFVFVKGIIPTDPMTCQFHIDDKIIGSVAKNLAFLQNQWIPSQLGNLINIITDKIAHKGKNCSLKLRKYYFCTRTIYEHLDRYSKLLEQRSHGGHSGDNKKCTDVKYG
jgi:hypothetical protein